MGRRSSPSSALNACSHAWRAGSESWARVERDAGGEEAAATPGKATARPAGARSRRERRWRRPARRKEKGDGGEVARDHGRMREGAKTGERIEGVPFYRRGEGAGHGRGRNGDGKHGRRPWKAAGEDAGVPGDWGHDSRGKLGGIEEDSMGIKTPESILELAK
uniref:Uncharacterized protein n=1 Tax=Oryza sativa subsp. japonica TaxID=39947 RepID=Q2QZR3_ORYSJ|nr:hypothetical protein LOC_Os11g45120 [Oryza sativa Japonica Group]